MHIICYEYVRTSSCTMRVDVIVRLTLEHKHRDVQPRVVTKKKKNG